MSDGSLRSRRASRVCLARFAAMPAIAALVLLSANASYLVRTATALAAAAFLLRAARTRGDRLARARRFFAAALLVGAGSGLSSTGYLLATGHPAEMGWFSDWLYLCYAPLAVAGMLSVPRQSGPHAGSVRALADGAVAAGSLWYLALVLVIAPKHLGADLEPVARAATLAFPLLPAFVLAVILSVLPRVAREWWPFLGRGAAGVLLLGAADVSVAVATWGESYDPASWIAGVSELGLLLTLDAALVRTPAAVREPAADEENGPSGLLVAAAPYTPLLLALAVVVREFLAGRSLTHGQLGPLLLVGVAVVVRHLATSRETARLVSRLAAREQVARTQAMTDALTGLDNRAAFVDRLHRALCDPAAHPVAVALLDLNDFKDINDTHGHDTGDEVLRQAAERLRQAVPTGTVARLGGDEFAVFVPASAGQGRSLALAVTAAFAEPVRVGSRPFSVRPSVGVVVDERPAGTARDGDASHLLAHADVAMYEAKKSKSTRSVPVAVLTGRERATATATIRIREEISNPDLTQFAVDYQPLVDLATGAIVGAEALLRWHHPVFGPISPTTFIPLAERVGSISVLGEHVLVTALDDVAAWTEATGVQLSVGVNVSPRQLTDPGLVHTVTELLAARRLPADQLTFEVTEEAFVDDIEAVVESIAALRAAGVSVAVDDFGTGYSSLRYLRRFDANVLKIDREFVQASATEPRTDALVQSVVSMADALDLACVAEGIETLEQLALMRAHGCQLGQGYLLDRPMPADSLAQLLAVGHVYPVDVQPPARPAAPVVLRAVRPG